MPYPLVPTDSPAQRALSDAHVPGDELRDAAQRAQTTARSRRVVTFIGAEPSPAGVGGVSITQGLGLTARAAIAASQTSKGLP
jgi:hypothetical protein